MLNFFPNIKIKLVYLTGKIIKTELFTTKFVNSDLRCELMHYSNHNGFEFKLLLSPSKPLEAISLEMEFDFNFGNIQKIFANGFQSWTDSREFDLHEKINKPGKIAKNVMKKYSIDLYGDDHFYQLSGKKGLFHSHTYTYFKSNHDCRIIGSLTEKTGFTIIESNVRQNKIKIIKDCEGAIWNSDITPLHIFSMTGTENEVFDAYFTAAKIKTQPNKPLTGWTSWYNYYQNITEDIIIENLHATKKHAPDFSVFQIDDGFQCAVGDWLDIDHKKFPKGMEFLASEIHKNDYLAGLWLAPFAAEKTSKIFKDHSNWILKDKNGNFVVAGGNWSTFYALDFYNDEVREYLKKVFDTVFNIWKYDLVKLDFLYAVCLVPQHGKSRGEIMCEAMEFMRECAKDKLILGCGVPLGAAFGLVDYCRIGCDIGLDWNDKFYMKYLHRERISTLNALVNTISRNHLNGRAFLNDPDVFLLREDNLKLTADQKNTLFTINSIFGSLVFTSDNFNLYKPEQFATLKKLSNFTIKQNIEVKTIKKLFFEISYIENNIKKTVIANLNRKTIKYNNLILRPFQTVSVEI